MRKISEYIFMPHDSFEGREAIEWANYWYSQTDKSSSNGRILLIGDSTARMVRSTLERQTNMPVDMIGTSCGLHDILFFNQIDAFFASSQFHYKTIFIQLGHHSIISDNGQPYGAKEYERFYNDYIGLIKYLQQYCSKIVLMSSFLNVKSIPKSVKGLKKLLYTLKKRIFGEEIDHSWSDTVIMKNKKIEEIAKEMNLAFCDIEGIIRKQCDGYFPKYIHTDHIHYENKAKKAIASIYTKYL